MPLSPHFFSPLLTTKEASSQKYLVNHCFKTSKLFRNIRIWNCFWEQKERMYQRSSYGWGAETFDFGSSVPQVRQSLHQCPPPTLSWVIFNASPALLYLSQTHITFEVPSPTFRSELMLLSSVAHWPKFSPTPRRSANIYLISPWPAFGLVSFPLNNLFKISLYHSIQGGWITIRYGWGVGVRIPLANISSCFHWHYWVCCEDCLFN